MTILGIDPGSVRVGFGIIKKENGQLICVKSGLLAIPKNTQADRLVCIEKHLTRLLDHVKIERAGLEKLFFAKNKKTALQVAEARGVILNTLTKKSIPCFEIAPTETKLIVTGYGHASKKEVAKMVCYTLKLPDTNLVDDVMDALAIAIATAVKIRY